LPGHDVHLYVDRLFFGRTYPRVHKGMDSMVKYFGWQHRIFFHDEVWARHIAIREYPNDLGAIESSWLHLLIDEVCSADPDFRRWLEGRAEAAKKQRKQMRMWRKQLMGETGKPTPSEKRTKNVMDMFCELLRMGIENQRQQGKLMLDILNQQLKQPKRVKDYGEDLIKFYKKLEARNKKTITRLFNQKTWDAKRKRR
jgi:hypothetical protein